MLKKNGFSLIEVMIVVAIIALLAAIATPNYLRHGRRARASEAVATMTMIRQAIRDHFIVTNNYFDVATGDIDEQPETGAAIDVGVARFFSNDAFSVAAGADFTWGAAPAPPAVDYVISVDGSDSEDDCVANPDDCALHQDAIADYRLEMDNTARVFVSYDAGANWSEY